MSRMLCLLSLACYHGNLARMTLGRGCKALFLLMELKGLFCRLLFALGNVYRTLLFFCTLIRHYKTLDLGYCLLYLLNEGLLMLNLKNIGTLMFMTCDLYKTLESPEKLLYSFVVRSYQKVLC